MSNRSILYIFRATYNKVDYVRFYAREFDILNNCLVLYLHICRVFEMRLFLYNVKFNSQH